MKTMTNWELLLNGMLRDHQAEQQKLGSKFEYKIHQEVFPEKDFKDGDDIYPQVRCRVIVTTGVFEQKEIAHIHCIAIDEATAIEGAWSQLFKRILTNWIENKSATR